MSFLTTVLKRSAGLPEDVSILTTSMQVLVNEMNHLSKAFAMLTASVQKHNEAIAELYAMQELIFKELKSASSDLNLPPLNKDKSQKPN